LITPATIGFRRTDRRSATSRRAASRCPGPLMPGLVRPVAVGMFHVLAKHQVQVALIEDLLPPRVRVLWPRFRVLRPRAPATPPRARATAPRRPAIAPGVLANARSYPATASGPPLQHRLRTLRILHTRRNGPYAGARNFTCPTFVKFMSHLHSLDIAQPWLPHNVGLWREITGGPS
jgi:hypothetical protein